MNHTSIGNMTTGPHIALNDVNDQTRNRLLRLGMAVMSVSGNPGVCMKTVVPEAISKPFNSSLVSYIQSVTCSNCSAEQIWDYLKQLDSVLKSERLCPKNKGRDRKFQMSIRDTTWTVVSLAALLVFLRLATRKFALKKIRWDDWIVALAMVLTLFYAGSVATGIQKHKACKRVWTVKWNSYRDNLRHLYHMELIYVFTNWMAHLAVMAFYWNLVPRSDETPRRSPFRFFHKSILFALTVVCATHIVSVFTIAFQCMPVAYWRDPLSAACLPRSQIWAITSTATVLCDILILSLPIRVVWKLELSIKEKLAVTGMLCLGIFACLAGIVRAVYTSKFLNDVDWTYSQCYATPLTVLEPSLAIIATCIPSLRVLAVKGLPKTAKFFRKLSATKGSSSGEASESDNESITPIEIQEARISRLHEARTSDAITPPQPPPAAAQV